MSRDDISNDFGDFFIPFNFTKEYFRCECFYLFAWLVFNFKSERCL